MAASLLELSRVSFDYLSVAVLDDVNLAVFDGEFLSLLGPSGCGKTTLLNLMAGFVRPKSGSIVFEGKDIVRPGPERAMVFQKGALFEWMTVQENVEFSLRCAGMPLRERRHVSEKMIRLVGLEGFQRRYPYELSGGMQQRVGVARVLASGPKIMLMDEPFAAVDVQTREALQEELLQIREETGCTIVFVTHSIEEAVFLSDRIVLFARGGGAIVDRYRVDLPTPRWDSKNRLHHEFIELREKIYTAMRGIAAKD